MGEGCGDCFCGEVALPRADDVPVAVGRHEPGREAVKVGPYPTFLAVAPDGRTVYAVTAGAMVPISTATGQAGQPVRVAKFSPVAVVIAPGGATAWVSGDEERGRRVMPGPGVVNVGYGFVLPVSTATNTPGRLVRAGMGAT